MEIFAAFIVLAVVVGVLYYAATYKSGSGDQDDWQEPITDRQWQYIRSLRKQLERIYGEEKWGWGRFAVVLDDGDPYTVESKEDLRHLSKDQASTMIGDLLKFMDKADREDLQIRLKEAKAERARIKKQLKKEGDSAKIEELEYELDEADSIVEDLQEELSW